MNAALSMRTVFTRPGDTPPYADAEGSDGLQRYKYRGEDPMHPENRALRRAYQDGLPLIWFVGVAEGIYQPIYPVWIVADELEKLQFVLALDEGQRLVAPGAALSEEMKRYVERINRVRLHQPMFRARVLAAYQSRCTVCQLRHSELLDAAHIIPDSKPHGAPVVPNGLAMCKIHHAAFDNDIMGVRPDLTVHIRQDVLEEIDGPMLRHGLQGMHNASLSAPRARDAKPRTEWLEERYAEFLER
jgi:putative restriction endonuclease